MYVCKNSGARWSLRNDGRKGSQESKEGNLYSISPLLCAEDPGWPSTPQTRSIPIAHVQPAHMPCSCLVLTGIRLDFSAQCSGEAFHTCRASHLHHHIFSSSTLTPLFPPRFLTSVSFKSLQAAAIRLQESPPFRRHPLPWQCLRPCVYCPHGDIPPDRALPCQTEDVQSMSAMDFASPLQKLQHRTLKLIRHLIFRNTKASVPE